jgi:hypothetical protein
MVMLVLCKSDMYESLSTSLSCMRLIVSLCMQKGGL